jgi:hypothetical protein
MMVGSRLVVHDGVTLKGSAGLYASILKMKNTFSNSSDFIRVGSEGSVNDLCLSQSRASAGNLVLNGASVISGVSYLLNKRILAVYSSGNDTGITFTIHGTDGDSQPQIDTFSGSNASFVQSSKFFLTVDSISVSGATAGNITVGWQTVASFNSRVEDIQLWSNHTQAVAGTSMIYSNNTQHTGGIARLKIFAGNRSACKFETGIGGASTVMFEDIECGNYGNALGVASNNPVVYVNWAGLNFPIKRLVINGNPSGGSSVGMQIDGGQVTVIDGHCENCATGILLNNRNINNGGITIMGWVGSGGNQADVIRIDAAATATPHIAVQNIVPNGATNSTINDQRTATLTTGFINTWTYK